jgi:hypothetical protein
MEIIEEEEEKAKVQRKKMSNKNNLFELNKGI